MHRLPGEFPASACTECGTVFLDPPPSETEVAAHYPATYRAWAKTPERPRGVLRRSGRRVLERPFIGGLAASALSRLAGIEIFRLHRLFPRPGRVLDVGCATGTLLDAFARLGWQTAGVEPGADAAAITRKKGHRVYRDDFFGIDIGGKFELVLFVHSLEHLREPRAALARAQLLLASDGVVFVATPNAGGLLARRAGPDWWQLDAPRHLVVFTASGLRSLADRAGLRVESLRTNSVPLGALVTPRLAREKDFLISDWFDERVPRRQRLVAKARSLAADALGRGDNLHAILRRM